MNINFTQVLKDFDNEILKENDCIECNGTGKQGNVVCPKCEGKREKEITLSLICTRALLTPTENDRGEKGEMKFKRFLLAKKIYNGKDVELEAKEIVLLENAVGNLFAPLIVGRIHEMLEGIDNE